jgi:hypothetical protein
VNEMFLGELDGYAPAGGVVHGKPTLTLAEFDARFRAFLLDVYHRRDNALPRWSALRSLLRGKSGRAATGCIALPLMCGVRLRMRKCQGSFVFSMTFAIVLRTRVDVAITGGNFRLLNRLLTQVERILEINTLPAVTKAVVEAARENPVIGQS